MPSNASHYQKVRLWSGIFSIGTNLGLIWAFYGISLLVSPLILRHFSAPLILLLPIAAMLALGFVFDRRVQELNASDTQLPNAKSSVFHPIPDLTRRLENLKNT